MKNNTQRSLLKWLGILSLSALFTSSCQTPEPMTPVAGPPELEYPDESIPWQRSGKVSSSSLDVRLPSKDSTATHDKIEFQKTYSEYPMRANLKALIASIEFSGPHPEIWQNWNQQVFLVVEKIKNELRRQPSLQFQLEKMNSIKRPGFDPNSGVREVPFSRLEIEFLPQGYELIFRSEIPALFEHRLRLETPSN